MGSAPAFSGSLDPIETNLPGGARGICSPPPGASGQWSPGWASTSHTLPRLWAAGWDRGERCPPAARSAAPRGGWRELGGIGGDGWRELHDKRRRVVNQLRRAGYVARHRWSRSDTSELGADRPRWEYTSGPANGCRAVDPWKLALELSGCGAEWYAQARITDGGELRAVAMPRACGRAHTCPVCAARESSAMAAALRSLTGSGRGALVTLTQRAIPGRRLADELDRLRAGMAALWSGRARAEWCARIGSWWYGIEVTRGGSDRGGWWHVHVHVLVEVVPGVEDEAAARWVGRRWAEVSEHVAAERGLPGAGWDPSAGGVRWEHTRLPRFGEEPEHVPESWITPRGGWWRPVDLSDAKQAYQACKYPTPAVELDPVSLAEFVAAAHGRRWHDGGGRWRGVRARAAELLSSGAVEAASAEAEAERYDIGRGVSLCGPGEAPALDRVAPGLGIDETPTPPELVAGKCYFLLSSSAPVEAVAAAAAAVGGVCYPYSHKGRDRVRLGLPASYVGALIHEWHAAIRAARERAEPVE